MKENWPLQENLPKDDNTLVEKMMEVITQKQNLVKSVAVRLDHIEGDLQQVKKMVQEGETKDKIIVEMDEAISTFSSLRETCSKAEKNSVSLTSKLDITTQVMKMSQTSSWRNSQSPLWRKMSTNDDTLQWEINHLWSQVEELKKELNKQPP